MKLNRKGFTLVELLVTIVIIGLVIGFSTYGIISLINNSEDKTKTLSESNIKEAARIYATEASSDSWKKTNDNYDAFCVTISELMNKGLLDKNAEIEGKIARKDFIMVKRNKITLAIENEEILSGINNNICTGEIDVAGEDYTHPKVESSTSYTDKLIISFTPGTASYQGKQSTITYKCLYGASSSNINREGKIVGNTCVMENLKNTDGENNKIPYYVYIYMNTNHGTSILAEDENESYALADFYTQRITQNKNKMTIYYNDTNVLNPSHYFKSTISGTVGTNVEKCTLKNNTFTCNENTQTIEENTWYKLTGNSITITYPEKTNTVNITTRIQDGSNNYNENTKTFNIKKYTVKFYKNAVYSIGGSTSNYIEKYCIAAGSSSCSITSPSIKANTGYSVVGWNTTSTSTTSSWNVGISKNISSDLTYYAITKINRINIQFNTNGGNINTISNTAGEWSKNNNDNIMLKKGEQSATMYAMSIMYGKTLTETQGNNNGLPDYNNSSWLDISKTGYSAVAGSEWICLSGCSVSNKTFDQAIDYSASDFCDASNGDCTVVLGVNWELTVDYIDLDWIIDGERSYSAGDSLQANLTVNGVAQGYISDYWEQHPYGTSWSINGIKLNGTEVSYTDSGTLGTSDPDIPVNTLSIEVNNTSHGTVSASSLYVKPGTTYSTSGSTFTLSDGRKITATATSATGYTTSFDGWSSTRGTINSATSINANFSRSLNTYTITYNLDGGSVSTTNKTSYTIETDTFTLNNPTKTGYTFTGWTGSNGTTAQTSVSISKGSTGNKEYTANWKSTGCGADYRYTYSSSKITVYYVGTCNSTTSCAYTSINGTSNSGTLYSPFYTKSALKTNLPTTTKYFASSTVNCYNTPSTSSNYISISWCNTRDQCTDNTKDPNCIAVWKTTAVTTTDEWYYSNGMCCYVRASDLVASASADNINTCANQ